MKTNNLIVLFCFGVILLFGGIWGGAWLCNIFPQGESVFSFPSFLTGFIVSIIGLVLAIFSAANLCSRGY